MKIFFNIVGFIALGLAIIGIPLPLVPTTPFLLLAAACFMRGSDRMHDWMTQNPLFGKYLRDFEEKKGVTLRVKVFAIMLMWLWLIASMYFVPPFIIPLSLIGLGVTAYMVFGLRTLPAQTPDATSKAEDKTLP